MSCEQRKLEDFGFDTDNRAYVIAEIGINHGGDIDTAKRLVDSASVTGVDAVKFQTYLTEKRVSVDSPIFDILKKCELSFKDFKELKEYTEQYDMEFFSTPFDKDSVDFLEDIGCNLYKVSSFDVTNQKLLSEIANTGKAVVMSTGMANLDEIKEAYNILKSGTDKIAILHCVSAYPTKEEDANLAAICTLKSEFECIIGQSDHTNDITVPIYAVIAGAQIIEKHYMIDNEMDCVDAPVSITEDQMKKLVNEIERVVRVFGKGVVGLSEPQRACEIFRRNSK